MVNNMKYIENVKTDTVNNYTVDTCHIKLYDEYYETAIKLDDHDWVVVATCDTETDALNYHELWVHTVKRNPKSVYSVQEQKEIRL